LDARLDNGAAVRQQLRLPIVANANSKDGAFRAVGIYGQTLHINPAKRVVVVQFSARPRPSGRGATDAPPVPFDAIAEALSRPQSTQD
jgi:CubicO group peptidase (beta-lactamase class C family)